MCVCGGGGGGGGRDEPVVVGGTNVWRLSGDPSFSWMAIMLLVSSVTRLDGPTHKHRLSEAAS